MSEVYGREVPPPHVQSVQREATRYLVVIPTTDGPIARLLLASREQVAEFNANTEEVLAMTRGLSPHAGATGPEWDRPLTGHSAVERAEALVYTLST